MVATTPDDPETTRYQFLGPSNSPVVVYDYEQKTVKVKSMKNAESEENYQKVKLPARSSQVALFVDEETRSKVTTRSMTPSTEGEGQSNVLLVQLHLDRLGLGSQIGRLLGFLSTLYVINSGRLKTSPETGSVQTV